MYLLGTDGRIVWEQRGCGNVHRAFLSNGRLFYSNGCLWRVDEPGKGAATLLYDPAPGAHRGRSKTGEGVYGFDLLENGNLLVAENATDFLSEITQDGKVVRRFKGNAAWLDGKTPKDVHHHYRMCRATAFGTWLVCCSGAGLVREFNPRTTAQVAQWKIGELAFDAYRKANGNTVVGRRTATPWSRTFPPSRSSRRRDAWCGASRAPTIPTSSSATSAACRIVRTVISWSAPTGTGRRTGRARRRSS